MPLCLRFRALALCSLLGLATVAHAEAPRRPSVETASHGAKAEVMRAAVKGDTVSVELRFEATTEPFGGEIVYAKLDREAVWIEAEGVKYPLVEAQDAAPAELRLNFSYDLAKTPRVGRWTGRFVSPPASVKTVTLHLSGLSPIKNIPLSGAR